MLVLSRQRDETVMIGDDIEVTVVDIRGDKVRLGLTAPREVSIHRKEVYDAIRRENRAAAAVVPELKVLPYTAEDQAAALKILREMGFFPFNLCLRDQSLGELVSYPFFNRPGDRDASIKVRTVVGDPMSMIEEPVAKIHTAQSLADVSPEVGQFLRLASPWLRTQQLP